MGPIGNLVRCWGRNQYRNFMWEGVVKVKTKAEPGESEHIRAHRRVLLSYFVDVLIN